MITVKFIAPGTLPGDYVTASVQGVPNRGDTVLVEFPTGCNETGEELLTVTGVTWPIELMPSIRHHAVAALPEVVCVRTPDAGIDNPATVTVYNAEYEQIDQFKTPPPSLTINHSKG